MSVGPPALVVPAGWTTDADDRSAGARRFRLRRGEDVVTVELERCVHGRLATAYPTGARDVEIRFEVPPSDTTLTDLLRSLADGVLAADPMCRKIVYAATPERLGEGAAALAAGFRPVVEVDVPEPVELFVAESASVTRGDDVLDDVPGT